MQKSPSSIWHQDSNPQPFEYESSPNTTRTGLSPKSKFYHINYTRGETLITSKLVLTFNEFSSLFWMKRNTGFISENHHLNAAERFIKYTKYVYEVKCDILFEIIFSYLYHLSFCVIQILSKWTSLKKISKSKYLITDHLHLHGQGLIKSLLLQAEVI